MTTLRPVARIVTGRPAVDGAGVKLVRVFGFHDTKAFDPFLMLDAFDASDPNDYVRGFPWHPHRGIETVTYLLEGAIDHGDSLGNHGVIGEGECQWMTAGSGIIHQEMPQASPRMKGAQLWVNLPAKHKMTAPKYGDIRRDAIPIVSEESATIRVIGGTYAGQKGAFQGDFVDVLYLDVTVSQGAEWTLETDPNQTLFVYLLEGEARFDPGSDETVSSHHAVLFARGDRLWVKAALGGVRFLLLCGSPLKEPIAWGGPIVMNTEDELAQAYRELENNTFIKR